MENYIGNFKDKNNNNLYTLTPKSAIMVYLSSNTTIYCDSAWGQFGVPFNAIKYQIGDKFVLNSNGEVIYSGTCAVKVTLHLCRASETTCGDLYPVTNIDTYYQEMATSNTIFANKIDFATAPQTISAYVRPSGTGNAVLSGDSKSTYTYMIVEEL